MIKATATGVYVSDESIGFNTAQDVFDFAVLLEPNRVKESDDTLHITFESGPDPSRYTIDKLRRTLDLMCKSRGEAEILRELHMAPGFRGPLPTTWKDVILYRGDQEFLMQDVWLDESTVHHIARLLHGNHEDGEEHCLTVILREDLPEDLLGLAEKLTPEQVRANAVLVIRHREISISIPEEEQGWTHSFGEVCLTAFHSTFLGNLTTKLRSTRLWVPQATT
jgi:hypothetical protein